MQVNNINSYPSFEGNNLHIRRCSNILDKTSGFTPDGYGRMSFISKFFLRKCTPDRMQELAKITCDIASKLKNKFDQKYGENNYMIIAVGRSIASVAETLNFMGGEAVVIPLSELRYYLPSQIQNIDVYRKYLDKIGLTKEKIRDNPDKKFVLMDYAVLGDSLSSAKEFLEKPELLGKSDNFIDYEINPIVKSLKTLKLFYHERFKNFSPVGKLPLENLKDVFIQADSTTSKEGRGIICQYARKMFLFNVLDSLHVGDFHGFIPEREYECVMRLESQEYLSKKCAREIRKLREQIDNILGLTK